MKLNSWNLPLSMVFIQHLPQLLHTSFKRHLLASNSYKEIRKGFKKPKNQDHRRWKYHCRLPDYQSPYFKFEFPLDHQKTCWDHSHFATHLAKSGEAQLKKPPCMRVISSEKKTKTELTLSQFYLLPSVIITGLD